MWLLESRTNVMDIKKIWTMQVMKWLTDICLLLSVQKKVKKWIKN